tara:strand:+ start:21125 stop:21229 length:105 start_codon:yes stop_codon:yes gene_type:complete
VVLLDNYNIGEIIQQDFNQAKRDLGKAQLKTIKN